MPWAVSSGPGGRVRAQCGRSSRPSDPVHTRPCGVGTPVSRRFRVPASSAQPGPPGSSVTNGSEVARQPAWAPVLAISYALLVVAAVTAPLLGVCAALVVVMVAEAWVARRRQDAVAPLRQAQLVPHARWLVRWSLVVVAVARPAGTDLATRLAADLPRDLASGAGMVSAALTVVVAAVLFARTGWLAALVRGRTLLRNRVRWQGLAVDGAMEGPPPVREPGFLTGEPAGPDAVLAVEWVLAAGLAASALLATWVPTWVAMALTAVAVLSLVARAALFLRAARSAPPVTVLPRVVEALNRLQPEVVVYFSSPPSGSYALRVWLDTLRRLRNR